MGPNQFKCSIGPVIWWLFEPCELGSYAVQVFHPLQNFETETTGDWLVLSFLKAGRRWNDSPLVVILGNIDVLISASLHLYLMDLRWILFNCYLWCSQTCKTYLPWPPPFRGVRNCYDSDWDRLTQYLVQAYLIKQRVSLTHQRYWNFNYQSLLFIESNIQYLFHIHYTTNIITGQVYE